MDENDYGWIFFVLTLTFIGLWAFYNKTDEWVCERDFNVYDCEYEWYPVYDEMSPEDEELMP